MREGTHEMARAGYCSACAQNVYVDTDGGCVNGHPASYVTNVYDVPDAAPAPPQPAAAPPVAQPPAAAYGAPAQAPPKKKRAGLIIAIVIIGLLLLCGCAVAGGFLLFASDSGQETSSSASSTEPVVSQDDPQKLEAALTLFKAMNTGDAELMKSVIPEATVAGVTPDFWTSFVESTSAGAPKLGTVDRKGATIVVETIYDDGTGSITFSISPTDGDSIDIHTVRADKSTSDTVAKVGDEGGTWKVLALSNGTTVIPFDLEGLNAFIANPPK